jgi:hypothetical protein
MQSLIDLLEQNINNPDLQTYLQKFFTKHPELLHTLIINTDKGNLLHTIVKDTLDELSSKLKDPVRAAKAVIELGLPTSKYEKFAKMNKW